MNKPTRVSSKAWMLIPGAAVLLVLGYGTWTNPNFWLTASQRGDRLMAEKQFKAAADTYTDPLLIGIAQYREGDFKKAASTFAHVAGAIGAFDQGNAFLMQGAYNDAIASYDSAMGFKPGWQDAEDNRALAVARKKLINDAGKNRDQESAEAYNPDDIKFDQKADRQEDKPRDMNDPVMSDASLRATWLRRVQTSTGDFLRAKFAYQAAEANKAGLANDADADVETDVARQNQ